MIADDFDYFTLISPYIHKVESSGFQYKSINIRLGSVYKNTDLPYMEKRTFQPQRQLLVLYDCTLVICRGSFTTNATSLDVDGKMAFSCV